MGGVDGGVRIRPKNVLVHRWLARKRFSRNVKLCKSATPVYANPHVVPSDHLEVAQRREPHEGVDLRAPLVDGGVQPPVYSITIKYDTHIYIYICDIYLSLSLYIYIYIYTHNIYIYIHYIL